MIQNKYIYILYIMLTIIPIFFLLITIISILVVIAPMIDHIFYIDHKLEDFTDLEIFIMSLVHIILTGFLVYVLHYYVIKKYFILFKIEKLYEQFKVVIDLILALTLVGLQRNLHFKIRYLSSKHPIRSKLIL